MLKPFEPDYRHILNAAYKVEAARLPLYEHNVDFGKIDEINGTVKAPLFGGDNRELDEFFQNYSSFFSRHGYDVVTFEACVGGIMPGSGCLGNPNTPPAIEDMADFERYPWDELEGFYFAEYSKYFQALRRNMPAGMRAIGGVGNGVFECVQDITGFENLCYLKADDPELYALLFERVGEVLLRVWRRFLAEFGDVYCVLRFGDDLGYKSNTMLSADDIRRHILPQYKRIVAEVHSYRKPFLLHSCGEINSVMKAIITDVGIDAKHSNEDQIEPFSFWVETYGDRIGNFGGIDMDAVCRLSRPEMKEYIEEVVAKCAGHGGIAFGTGNSIPGYVPAEDYLNMIEIVREIRSE
ncbi:MAG: uroporphyrinogen decarboxylase family protein [Oscillospiraceae bacterium]